MNVNDALKSGAAALLSKPPAAPGSTDATLDGSIRVARTSTRLGSTDGCWRCPVWGAEAGLQAIAMDAVKASAILVRRNSTVAPPPLGRVPMR
jgi:hypothetical protein